MGNVSEEIEPRDPEADLPRMTLSEHLNELRRRVVRSAVALLVGMIVAFVFNGEIFEFATAPYRDAIRDLHVEGRLQALSPLDGFMQAMKLCFIVAIVGT